MPCDPGERAGADRGVRRGRDGWERTVDRVAEGGAFAHQALQVGPRVGELLENVPSAAVDHERDDDLRLVRRPRDPRQRGDRHAPGPGSRRSRSARRSSGRHRRGRRDLRSRRARPRSRRRRAGSVRGTSRRSHGSSWDRAAPATATPADSSRCCTGRPGAAGRRSCLGGRRGATSSMYSPPRSRAIASWIGRGSGRVTRLIVLPRAAPPVAAAVPSTAVSARSRRRDGSVGADIRCTDQVAARPITRHTRPVMTPRRALPANPTASPTSAASSTSASTIVARPDITTPVSRTERRTELGAFPIEVEEGHRHDAGADLPALALHGPFDGESRAELREPLVHRAEADHLLDRRPPPDGGRPPHLGTLPVHRDRGAVHERRDLRAPGRDARTSPRSRPSPAQGPRAAGRVRRPRARRAALACL